MSGLVEHLLTLAPIWVYLVVGLLVFAEDALFVGFVIPGETAAVVGGVAAALGHTNVVAMCVIVVAAAIVGDSVGYEVGRHYGSRLLRHRFLDKRRDQLDKAQAFLARKGGSAVFLGRFVAFFRAVMPALAGSAKMPYRRFLPWNALGGVVWGIGFVVLGFLAGNSYQRVAAEVGRGSAIVVAVVVVIALAVWRVRRHRAERENVHPSA
ncbi:MAG: DedA family protein [Mycobacteriaceae bacterium]